MKRIAFLLLCIALVMPLYADEGPEVKEYVLQVGEKKRVEMIDNYGIIVSDYSVIDFRRDGYYKNVTGRHRGIAYVYYTPTVSPSNIFEYGWLPQQVRIFRVVDVIRIDIPQNVFLSSGDSYSFTPIITDAEAVTTLTWTSSNPSIATVSSNGVVTAKAVGNTTITCTAANGVKAQSLVTVSPLLSQSVTIDIQDQEIQVGESIRLSASVLPSNVSDSRVKWLSGNENIAQVDDEGNITAIGPGYCSIYAIANDGSGKYNKCLVHVPGPTVIRGDMNGDESVDIGDIVSIIDIMTSQATAVKRTANVFPYNGIGY